MNIRNYIEINSEKRFGKPIIKGTRISVFDVLNWLANGMSREEIFNNDINNNNNISNNEKTNNNNKNNKK